MKKYLLPLLIILPLCAFAQTSNVTMSVKSDGTLRAPTNFFAANIDRLANALNNAGYAPGGGGGDSTNELNDRLIIVGTDLTNRIDTAGTEATNRAEVIGSDATNRIATVGTEGTNYTKAAGLATTNAFFANDVVTSNALYDLISAKLGTNAALFLLSTNNGSGLTNLNATELRSGSVPLVRLAAVTNALLGGIGYRFYDGGSLLATGLRGIVPINYGGTILSATIVAQPSGSAEIEVRKCSYSAYDGGSTHPVTGDKINASAPPTLTTATKSTDTTLTGWTTSFSPFDVFEFYINSANSVTNLIIVLQTLK